MNSSTVLCFSSGRLAHSEASRFAKSVVKVADIRERYSLAARCRSEILDVMRCTPPPENRRSPQDDGDLQQKSPVEEKIPVPRAMHCRDVEPHDQPIAPRGSPRDTAGDGVEEEVQEDGDHQR